VRRSGDGAACPAESIPVFPIIIIFGVLRLHEPRDEEIMARHSELAALAVVCGFLFGGKGPPGDHCLPEKVAVFSLRLGVRVRGQYPCSHYGFIVAPVEHQPADLTADGSYYRVEGCSSHDGLLRV